MNYHTIPDDDDFIITANGFEKENQEWESFLADQERIANREDISRDLSDWESVFGDLTFEISLER